MLIVYFNKLQDFLLSLLDSFFRNIKFSRSIVPRGAIVNSLRRTYFLLHLNVVLVMSTSVCNDLWSSGNMVCWEWNVHRSSSRDVHVGIRSKRNEADLGNHTPWQYHLLRVRFSCQTWIQASQSLPNTPVRMIWSINAPKSSSCKTRDFQKKAS